MREIKLKYFNLYTTLRDIFVNWWVILLAAIIGVSVCQIGFSTRFKNRYTSTMTVAVNISGYNTSTTSLSLSRTIEIATAFQNVLSSEAMSRIIEDNLGEKMSGTLKVAQKENTNLIDISVTDVSPDKAYYTLKAAYENYPKLTDASFSNITISVISNPNMPKSVSNTSQKIAYSLFAAVLSACVCVLSIVVISYFRDTVKNIDDVEEMLEGRLFGIIYHVNKRKSRIRRKNDGLLLTNPLIDAEFSGAFTEMALKLQNYAVAKDSKVFMMTSIAENEGKTTTCVNMAMALAQLGKKVVIVDADLKLPAVHKFFESDNFSSENELGKYILGETDYESLLKYDRRAKVTVVCNRRKYRNSADILSTPEFKNLLAKLRENFDFVIIDTPPGGIAVDAEIITELSDGVLFVIRQDCAKVEAINDYLIENVKDKLTGCIFNDYCEFNRSETI